MLLKDNGKSIIKSVLFLIFGALIFAYADTFVSLIASAFGVLLLLYGLFLIIRNYYETKNDSNTPATILTLGIVLVLIGILFIILSDSIRLVIQYVIGAWILFNAIERLIIALSMPKKSNQFISQLIIALLLLAAGLYTILVSNIAVQAVGIVMMVYAVLEIVGYFTSKIVTTTDSKEEKTALVEKKDKSKNKKGKVKEAKVVEEVKEK